MPAMSSAATASISTSLKRGALIVLEGCDKAGKSTHAKLLLEALKDKHGKDAHLINFPDRTTAIGKTIDAYLKCQMEVSDQAIHLLFSANRWELVPRIKSLLLKGDSVILDRYAFSGVAFSAAKGHLDLNWCMSPDIGLPQPDRVIFLSLPEADAAGRGDFGRERYETKEFQAKVKDVFLRLREKDDSYWTTVDTNRDMEQVHQDILDIALKAMEESGDKEILPLWDNLFLGLNIKGLIDNMMMGSMVSCQMDDDEDEEQENMQQEINKENGESNKGKKSSIHTTV